ncbi:hypothetical protein PFLG_02621 [Plasmodium falciparum RAJ116]|uniref:Uncharacterized protein n=1 Tax=Plasmodium falciparum RAJ116 TaxID=580058 RepID=A0A0L0D1K9_PLAFA|nr:hypothetical protein PFLG_02621 [Plasmodium falciparum RAJ116]
MKGANFNVFSEDFYHKQNLISVLNYFFVYFIIAGACFIKIPQLRKIITKKTAVATSLIVFSIYEKINFILYVDVILISCFSKLPQIYLNHKNKNTGNLSLLTYTFILCGNLARIFIILFNIKNQIYLIVYYWKNTTKILMQADKIKKK